VTINEFYHHLVTLTYLVIHTLDVGVSACVHVDFSPNFQIWCRTEKSMLVSIHNRFSLTKDKKLIEHYLTQDQCCLCSMIQTVFSLIESLHSQDFPILYIVSVLKLIHII
jgi:hypothetical protein